jgi:hypothetical protein
MALKYDHKVIQFNPTTATETTLTTALNTQGLQGWEFVAVFQNTTTKAFALFRKALSE